MAGKKWMPKEKQILVCADYINGMKPIEISMKYGISANGVWYMLKRYGVQTRGETKPK